MDAIPPLFIRLLMTSIGLVSRDCARSRTLRLVGNSILFMVLLIRHLDFVSIGSRHCRGHNIAWSATSLQNLLPVQVMVKLPEHQVMHGLPGKGRGVSLGGVGRPGIA